MNREDFENMCKCFFVPFAIKRKDALDVGKEYGLTAADVGTIRKIASFSASANYHKLNEDDKQNLIKDYMTGKFSLSNLGRKYGISKVSVFRYTKNIKRITNE